MRTEKLGALRARILGGTDDRGGGEGPIVVLMHGFGAPGDDLVALGPELLRAGLVPSSTRFVFPEAPLSLDLGFGDARAWWMIDMERMQRAIMLGRADELAGEDPAGLDDAREKISALLEALPRALGTSRPLVLGGFSQGAMLACDLALRSEVELAGLVVLSGSLVAEPIWTPLVPRRRGLPVFQSHGTFDPILPFAGAERLARLLRDAGLASELVTFGGGHEITRPVLLGLGRFLARVLTPSP